MRAGKLNFSPETSYMVRGRRSPRKKNSCSLEYSYVVLEHVQHLNPSRIQKVCNLQDFGRLNSSDLIFFRSEVSYLSWVRRLGQYFGVCLHATLYDAPRWAPRVTGLPERVGRMGGGVNWTEWGAVPE